MKNEQKTVTRREFLSLSALGLASLTILPSWAVQGVRIAPSDRVVMGFIGLGQQGLSDFNSFSRCLGIQVAGCSDVDFIKVERFINRVNRWAINAKLTGKCTGYEFYEDLLARKDIDAVSIATPDHWHALCTIHAAMASKDVYCQKPLSYTISESLAMVRAVRENKRVLQVGSQQRSDKEFQKAIFMVRSGAIGHIEKIYAKVGDPPKPYDLPEMPIPANLNFNKWMGPLNDPKIHYNSDICPVVTINPDQNEKLWGAWRWYSELGNGYTADWGAHMFDIAQAAIGMDGSQAIEYVPIGYEGTQYSTMKYANGIVMTEQPYRDERSSAQGIRFIGDKGWIRVARGFIDCSDPALLEKSEQDIKQGQYEESTGHMQNFINCVRSRQNPIAPVEVGCSTNILCCLVNIAHELKRPVKWDPATHSFINDKEAEAHRLYWYKYRNPYTLPYWD